ncbi:MAG: hypothetical protein KIT80_10390 [Chitinophagaceae bacterium]|nr:hypothetical protein [Chitinophagaceae bacterium]MCW5927309.1 hypothetical protein [Chitinophagaceae bacterium]
MTSAHQKQGTLTTVSINAVGGLKYDKVRFQVKPGSKVKLIFANKDDMPHNLVITEPGARIEVANAASGLGDNGVELNYVPKHSKVLWSTALLNPGETTSLIFSAPEKEGIYPYVCTYPGHSLVMFGVMYVTNKAIPLLENDPNIPPGNKSSDVTQQNAQHPASHFSEPAPPYTKVPPFLYRAFIPDASPTAIAVRLPQNISYCWDAATCYLRYAWEGEFLDNTEIWKGHFQAYAKVMGTVFFRNNTRFPLYVDKPGNVPTVKFKGYRLVNRYPEFHYTINGIDVYELLKENKEGTGLIRTFRIPKSSRIIWFAFTDEDGVNYTSSVGNPTNGKLELSPGENIQFTIIMTKKRL